MEKKSQTKNAVLFVLLMLSSVIGAFLTYKIAGLYSSNTINRQIIIVCSLPFIIIAMVILLFYYRNKPSDDRQKNKEIIIRWIKDIIAVIFVGLGLGSIGLIVATL